MSRADILQDAMILSNWLSHQIEGKEIEASLRNRLAGGCFSSSLDHFYGMIALAERGVDAPSLALIRPQIETYLMGSFLSVCATDQELKNYQNHRALSAEALVVRLERTERFKTGALRKLKDAYWQHLSEFSHAGFGLVVRLNSEGEIGPTIPDSDVSGHLRLASMVAILAAQGILLLNNDLDTAAELLERMKALSPVPEGE